MKVKLLSILLLFTISSINSQRFLTDVFSNTDSIIGGIYGSSINNQTNIQDLLFDFYEPTGDSETKRPLIIYVHGGGFTSGSRSYPSVKLFAKKMALKGYTVANIDYRLDTSFDLYNSNTDRRAMTDAMQDAKQAIRYFKANASFYKIDTNAIFLGGESAGAITAMMASYVNKQSEMNAYPLANPNDPIGSTSNLSHSNDVKATLCLCGMILDTVAIENNNTSILWIHGGADPYIPISLSFNIVLRFANIGLPVQGKTFEGGTHCPWYYGNPNWSTYLDSTVTEISTFLYPQTISLGQQNSQRKSMFNVYPNPTANNLNIELQKQYKTVSVSIFNHLGQFISSKEYENTQLIRLDTTPLKKGFYAIVLYVDNIIYSQKFIKQE